MAEPHFIILDASYFVFFRYNATRRWWSFARKAGEPENGLDSPRYRDKFMSTFSAALTGLVKLTGVDHQSRPAILVAAFDCPRDEIWRLGVCSEYKGTRGHNAEAAAHFAIVKEKQLFDAPAISAKISQAGLEGDDCIALMVQEIRAKKPEAVVTIVSSDGDFKQLLCPKTRLMNLKGGVTGGMEAPVNPKEELFCKIVAGDSSDNIPAVFPRCGKVTALKMYNNPSMFEHRLLNNPLSAGTYEKNRLLVDFARIPRPLVLAFRRNCLRVVEE